MRSDGSGYTAYREQAERYGVGVVRLQRGDTFPIGDARVRVVWPPPGSVPDTAPDAGREVNDTSIVLDIAVGVQRILLTGDLEEDMDHDLLDALGPVERRLDLLKVAHHGSGTASSAPLLRALRPRLAVVSVGDENTYGHPAPSTLARLAEVGARILRTDLDGTVALSFDGVGASDAARAASETRPGAIDPGPLDALLPSVRCRSRRAPRLSGCSRLRTRRHDSCSTRPSSRSSPRSSRTALRPAACASIVGLVETAALLHDVDKAFRDDDPLKRFPHGRAGAEHLRGRRSSRAGPLGREPSGHASRGRLTRRHVAGRVAARGADRRLRGQARDAARGVARPALRAWHRAHPARPRGWTSRTSARGGWRRSSATRSASRRWGSSACDGSMRRGARTERAGTRRADRPTSEVLPPPSPTLGRGCVRSAQALARVSRPPLPLPASPMTTWRADADDDAATGEGPGPGSAVRRRTRTSTRSRSVFDRTALRGRPLVVVRQPGALAAGDDRPRPAPAAHRSVPPGNALCFTDPDRERREGPGRRRRRPGRGRRCRRARVRELTVPPAGRLEGLAVEQAGELGSVLQPDAARLLAERVGGHVREGDVDRRRRTELAHGSSRSSPSTGSTGRSRRRTSRRSCREAIPGSTWAFLDAVGSRSIPARHAWPSACSTDGTPMPLLVAQVHRRLRDLVLIREHIDAGSRNADIVRTMRLQPFRAQKFAEQAQHLDERCARRGPRRAAGAGHAQQGHRERRRVRQLSDAIDGLGVQAWRESFSASGVHAGRGCGLTDPSPSRSDRGQTGNRVARSWTTASDSIAKTHRPSGMSSSSIRSGSR